MSEGKPCAAILCGNSLDRDAGNRAVINHFLVGKIYLIQSYTIHGYRRISRAICFPYNESGQVSTGDTTMRGRDIPRQTS